MSGPTFSGAHSMEESFDTLVIGGGQSGLAMGYCLKQQNENFAILDENLRTGESWRRRWDSLRLFTPSQFNGLPGFPFPKPYNYFPTKDEVADYLESYAVHFELPVRHGTKIDRLSQDGEGYCVSAGPASIRARRVVIATGPYRFPKTPALAAELDGSLGQLHSSAYANPQQVQGEAVLVVGAGNSGAEIALELASAGKHVWLAGRDVGRLPVTTPIARAFGGRPAWWLMSRLLSIDTPIGRRAKEGIIHKGNPLGRARRQQLVSAGVELTPRVSGVESGKPRLEDGRILPAEFVIWATGFRPEYKWIELPVINEDGQPRQSRGIVENMPGLYFVGLPFQTRFNSSLLGGVGTDSAYIAGKIRAASAAA